MTPVRIGAVRVAAVLAAVALAGTGCDSINEAKESVDTAANKAEVCSVSTKLILEKINNVGEAAKSLTDPSKLPEYKKAIAAEFAALHAGLEEQVEKAKDTEVKDALGAMDKAAAGWATNPDSFVSEQNKLPQIAEQVDKACGAS